MTEIQTNPEPNEAPPLTPQQHKEVREKIASPIDQAIAHANRPGQIPVSAVINQKMRERQMPSAPMDYSPGQVPEDDPARHALGQLHSMWSAISEAAGDSSVPIAQLTSLGTAALEHALSKCDATVIKITKQIEATERQIKETTRPIVPGEMAAEIRSYVRSAFTGRDGKPKQDPSRMQQIVSQAAHDPRVASALLSGPKMLTGLSDEMLDIFKRSIRRELCPESTAKLDQLKKSLELVERGSQRAIEALAPKLRTWADREPESIKTLRKGASK